MKAFILFFGGFSLAALDGDQGLLLAGSKGQHGMPGIEPRLGMCKANACLLYYHSSPCVLFLQRPQGLAGNRERAEVISEKGN